ncbi:hypothetical protein CONPUDRAFT_144290 [Coniophora puteana RWD-64-598 SS2]|uniref:AMMECR1 domain-containing protein n=1 Tax=Coniophora puteana (strain RWD-64-598) TaxID=741705 RepID=A0A5M3MR71_CONPW|nr:uncharacterized protein CONPUDRAFT_144290 [Coniophora puteana RWD-64-598 SS2]EIW81570.1 hypothetical protein CONPUDRAFT_144290 [Coniophora puteana RWD-64-598 SS2]
MLNLPLNVEPVPEPTPEMAAKLQATLETSLQNIIKANIPSQFGRSSPILSTLRDNISSLNVAIAQADRTACAHAFNGAQVPFTEYEVYAPYISKFFNSAPCSLSDVEDLLAPGLPTFLGMSSTTSGKGPKPVPRYVAAPPSHIPVPISMWVKRVGGPGKTCMTTYCGYKKFVEISDGEGAKPKRIPLSAISGVMWRGMAGFSDFERDEERLAEFPPDSTAPWGVALISNYRSFILTHAAFALAEETLETLCTHWSTTFVDLIRWIDEEWDTLIDAIDSGRLPRYPETDDVYPAIATQFIANPARAKALREAGPPSHTSEGWILKIWPGCKLLGAVCTGTFGRLYPQLRACIGPDMPIRSLMVACTECLIGTSYDDRLPCIVRMQTDDYIEMIEVLPGNQDGELVPLWKLETGKVYEPVVTTRDGLWRYRTRDAVVVRGFSPAEGVPLIEYKERRNQSMWVAQALISQADIFASIAAVPEFEDVEFTTWWDDRSSPPTVGFFLEDMSASRVIPPATRTQILVSLLEANSSLYTGPEPGSPVRPSIRLLAPGTFGEFRLWKGAVTGMGSTQVKVPTIMLDPKAQEFILARVVGEVP